MALIMQVSIGIVLGCLWGQKELEQLYKEYKSYHKGEDL